MNAPIVHLTQRPMVWAAAGFAAGIAVISRDLEYLGGVVILASFVVGFAALFMGRLRFARPIGVALLFFAAGSCWYLARFDAPQADDLFQEAFYERKPEVVTLEGRVSWPSLPSASPAPSASEIAEGVSSATWKQGTRQQFVLEVDGIYDDDGRLLPRDSRCLVRWSDTTEALFHGQHVRVEGVIYSSLSVVNEGVSSPEDFYRRQNIQTLVRARGEDGVTVLTDTPWWSLGYWASRLRLAEAELLSKVMPEDILPFVYTVWLGDRSGIGEQEMKRYALAGTAHVLAVSGVHIAIVFVSLASVLRGRMSQRARALTLLIFLAVFVLLTGARVSVVRAAIMISVFLIGDLFDRDPDPLTSLSIAGLIMLIAEPVILMNPGFQMSFLSVASLLLITPRLDVLLAWMPRRLRLSLTVTLGVQVLSLPVAASTFQVVPLLSPLVNLFVVPLLAVVLWLTMLATALGAISASLGSIFGYAASFAVAGIEGITGLAAEAVGPYGYWGPPSALSLALYFTAIAIAMFVALRPMRRWVVVCAMLMLSVILWPRGDDGPFLAMLDVGHGDATVIRSPEGKVVVIDGGDRYAYGDYGRRVVSPFLRSHGIRRIDIMIATHGDRDHVGGLLTLIDYWHVGECWVSAASKGSPLENALIKKCEAKGVPVKRVHLGVDHDLGGGHLEVLHPPVDWPQVYSENDGSVVVRYTEKGVRTLLTADVEYAGEAALRRVGCEAEILKVPHHASNTSSSAEFLVAVDGEAAIASTGYRPGRDPVHEEVFERFSERSARITRTDRVGSVILRVSHHGRWRLSTARGERGWLP